MNVDQRSETNEELLYRGILPVAMSGRLVRCHAWSDGTVLPVLVGFDDPDPDPDPDPDDDPDDDDDDDADDPANIKDPKLKAASQEAAKYRVQRNEARSARDALRTEVADLKTKLKEAETKGAGDESLKTRIAELEAEVKEKDTKLSELGSELKGTKVARQVASAVADLKIKDDPKYVLFLLNQEGLDETDEDGEIEELPKILKRLIKSKDLKVRTDEDEDDDDPDDDTPQSSGRSSGRTMNGKRKSKADLDRATLEKKYPALRR